ncbi:HDOD domain-containing protein [Granulicella sp. L46]|uniref:HDOD domain-containing protein n=1 Tax=Granulicella sp. L46 TaxID=1641865 RepID=UPI00131C4C22|nr:HDOD domain-containing protein [Granulicella sp. L46]
MKRILFVDDEENVLNGIRRMLRSSRDEWEMEFVASGEAALQACSERAFDVVVSDLRMPGMDGAQLLSEIRDRYPGTARIVLSGYSDAALAAKAVPVAYRVLGKPCEPAELKETIDRVCTLQEVISQPALRRVIGTLGELPTLSATYLALSNAINDECSSISTIAKIVEQDVGMSTKILQVANCGFFGLSSGASSIAQAVGYLGMNVIKTLALQTETFRTFVPSARIPTSYWEKMQRNSQHTAVIAGTLPVTREIREVTMIAALLHDAGILALASAMPDQFALALDEIEQKNCSQVEAEEAIFGTSHAEIGAYLLGLWGIPSIAIEAIAHHHHPSRIHHMGLDCSLAVYLSDLIAHGMEKPPDDFHDEGLTASDRIELATLGLLDQYAGFRGTAMQALDVGTP